MSFKQAISDAKAFTLLRVGVMIAIAAQILVGQAMSLSVGNGWPVTDALVKMVGRSNAQVSSAVIGCVVLGCIVSRKAKFYGSLLYTLYTFIIAAAMWQFNPLLTVLYAVYGLALGVVMVVCCRGGNA